MIHHRSVLLALVLVCLALAACGGPQGAHLRFARASPDQIRAAESSGQIVWYDFEAGDEVPLEFGLVGVSQAETDQPARMVARRPFSIVVFPSGQTYFSFDGQSLSSATTVARWSIALGTDEQGARAALVLFIGQPQDVPAALQPR